LGNNDIAMFGTKGRIIESLILVKFVKKHTRKLMDVL